MESTHPPHEPNAPLAASNVRNESRFGTPARPPHDDTHAHSVQFYEDQAYLATVVSEFLLGGLTAGQPLIVIATPGHRRTFSHRLRELGIEMRRARESRHLTMLDARQTMAKFMTGDRPDASRFAEVMGELITHLVRGREGTPVRAYGEMVDLLWQDGNTEGALELERLWNELATRYHFSLLCAYSMSSFYRAGDAESFQRVCAAHTHVVPTEREADLRDILENAAEGIHLVGPDGTIEWANAAELEMLGYASDEYVGRNIREFHVDAHVIKDILVRLTAGETLRGMQVRLRHKDGSVRHVLLNSNVRFREGKFIHTRCFSRDITELRAAAEEREVALAAERAARLEAERSRREALDARELAEQARAVAEQANRAKSEFLAVMSHELRTPLNAIGGYAELMEMGIHGAVSPEQREALERIQRSQRMLLGLINQVLNYARIETGNIWYDLGPIPLDEALRSAEGLVTPQLRSQGLRFEASRCADDICVQADGEKLQQIVVNLLTNAVKFTDRGGTVRLEVEATGTTACVHVSDTGIGIPKDRLDVIFDPFVQVDPHYTRTRDGVGLGLAISRDLARGMGGELSVVSAEGKGSTFTLVLPRWNDGATSRTVAE